MINDKPKRFLGNLPASLKFLITGIVAIAALAIINPVTCVGPSERGIRVTLGKAHDDILQPGIHFRAPFLDKIETYSISPQTYDLFIPIDQRGAISKDNQLLGAEGKIVWNIDPDRVYTIVTRYPSISGIEKIINNTSYEALKAIIGQYSIYDLPGNMSGIASAALVELKAKLADYPIQITQFNVVNFDWSDDFDRRINETMAATQRVRQAEQEAQIAEQEQKKVTITAKAKADALVAEADGEKQAAILRADAKKAEGEGIAAYNRAVAQNSGLQIRLKELEIELERAKRWNGKEVPGVSVMTPAGTIVPVK